MQSSAAHRIPGFCREAQRVALIFLSESQKKSGGLSHTEISSKTTGASAAQSDLALCGDDRTAA